MASSINTNQRRSRTTAEQLSRMVDFLMGTPGLAGSRFLKRHGKAECDKKWTEMATMLNSLGGAVKTVEQWRTVWRDLKSRTSLKVRDRNRKQAMTGNNPIYEQRPTELERRVIALTGKDYQQGDDACDENVPQMEQLQLRKENEESIIVEINSMSPDELPSVLHDELQFVSHDELPFEIHEASANMRSSTPVAPSRRTPITPATRTTRSGATRRRVGSASEIQKTFLEVAQTQASALKMLAESSVAAVESASKQADALKLLADCSVASVQATKLMAESMVTMGNGLKACADAFNNLTNAIYRL
ncbi:uncharacterized protein [Eurosta solidaginis]|uniref:uncharacterized protein isoform X1 n=1 Tax=Eurosta solidaginis TaxID=178769 RepID=UPI003530C66A